MIKKVVITGADGFVGSYTVKEFLNNGYHVLAVDMHNKPTRLENHKYLQYVQCDLFNEDLMMKISEKDYDTFLHFAWTGSAGEARTDYNLQIKNALKTIELMKVAKSIGCRRFIVAGSIMEYEVEYAIHQQGSKPNLGYIYGIGKQLAHSLCKVLANEIGIDLVWPMITNAYGVGEMSPRFVNSTLKKIIKNELLEFTSATQNYDFIYVSDVARAFYLITINGKPFSEYIIGSGNAKPLKEFINDIVTECAPDSSITFGNIPFSGTNLPIKLFDTKPIELDCGFKPTIDFTAGTKLTLEWLRKVSD